MKGFILIYLLLAMVEFQLLAQSSDETHIADSLYRKGVSLISERNHKSAFELLKNSSQLYLKNQLWSNYFEARLRIGDVKIIKGSYNEALDLYLTIIKDAPSKLGAENLQSAMANNMIGICYKTIGSYNLALKYHEIALSTWRKLLGESHGNIANAYFGIGNIHGRKGSLKVAIFYFEKALEISSITKGKEKLTAACYNNLGNAYFESGAYGTALEFYKNALNMWQRNDGSVHINVSYGYLNVGRTYNAMGHTDIALKFIRKANFIQEGILESKTQIEEPASDFLGEVYDKANMLDSSLYFYHERIKFERLRYSKGHPYIAKTYSLIAKVYTKKRNFHQAARYFLKALEIWNLKKNLRDFGVIETLNGLGTVRYNEEHFEKAMQLYQKALNKNTQNSRETNILNFPEIKNYPHKIGLIESLHGKALALEKYGLMNIEEESILVSSLNHLQESIIQSNNIRQAYINYDDKLQLSKTISQIYESAIRVSLKLYGQTQEEKYKLQALYFSEKSKAGVLTEALTNMSAKSFGILPDSVITLEKEIKIDQNYYQTKIQNEKVKLDGYDTLEMARWEDKLFTLNRQSDSLVLALEKNYSRYHELKYQSNILSVEDVQQKLNSNEVLLEYFVGEEQTYLFSLTQNTYNIHTIENDSSRQDQIINFRKNLQASILGGKAYKKMYATQAYDIYKDLLKPALTDLDSGINKLIIIPDADLGYIPFDILITENMTGKQLSYQNLPYLLKEYQTTYGYSASLLFNDFERKQKKFDQQFLAFAPQYENLEIDSVRGLSLGKFRDQVTSLKYNTPEVNSINEYMDGLTFTGTEAREEAFKNYAGNSSILHLAMHAFVDDDNPMNSKLVFTQANDTIEDNFLHAYELYNMELPADMAVLSACETGFGKLEKGEGIMSLARAFSYAGCPSVVMSHWSVNDAATAKLMGYFYKYLSEGLEKDAALQQAKLEFLRTAGPVQANPFFWGSFVVMGNTDPIEMVKKRWEDWYYVVGLLLMLGMIVVGWKVRKGARIVSER